MFFRFINWPFALAVLVHLENKGVRELTVQDRCKHIVSIRFLRQSCNPRTYEGSLRFVEQGQGLSESLSLAL